MTRCPKCDATYAADAAWCPVDGTQLAYDDALHTLTEDVDAGHTLRDLQVPLVPGTLTMGWEIPDVPQTLPGAVLPPALMPMAPPPPKASPPPSALTMGWEIPEVPEDEPPRTTPTQLAALGGSMVPTTIPGVPTPPTTNRLKAASLPPAAPRMTPQSLAAALAKAPSPRRPEPMPTPTSVNVQLPAVTPAAMTVPIEPEAESETETIDAPTITQAEPSRPMQTRPLPAQIEPRSPVGRAAPTPTQPPPLGPPPNLTPTAPRPASPSQPPPMRRLITQPMPSVASAEHTPVIEVMPVQAPSQSMESQPHIELTAPVPQISVELRAPVTMPGVVAPEIRTSMPQFAARKPPSPSDAPPMGGLQAVPSQLNQPSGAMRPPAPDKSNRWMWIAIALIVAAGAVGTLLALQ